MKSVVTARLVAAAARASRQEFHPLDDYGVDRHAAVERRMGAGGPRTDRIDYLQALDDLAEHRVTPARGTRIEIDVVGEVHVELARARVRLGAARESYRAAEVAQAVAGLVHDSLRDRLLL